MPTTTIGNAERTPRRGTKPKTLIKDDAAALTWACMPTTASELLSAAMLEAVMATDVPGVDEATRGEGVAFMVSITMGVLVRVVVGGEALFF